MSPGRSAIEGRLDIRVAPKRAAVSVLSTRPTLASRLFEGRTIDETLKLMPLVFNVCGQAQSVAAVRAIESAIGETPNSDVQHARVILQRLETLREHLWRVLFEWPEFCGGERANASLGRITQDVQALKQLIDPEQMVCRWPGLQRFALNLDELRPLAEHLRQSVASQVFGGDTTTWLHHDQDTFLAWADTSPSPAAQLLKFVRRRAWESLGNAKMATLPKSVERELTAILSAEGADVFVAQPTWKNQTRETGPSARQAAHPLMKAIGRRFGNGLLWRLTARLIEIAELSSVLLDTEKPPRGQTGFAQLEAARGRLCHYVELEGEKVSRYRILAPTEWNFHPSGVAVRTLTSVRAADESTAQLQARLLVHSIDPCVGYDLHIEES